MKLCAVRRIAGQEPAAEASWLELAKGGVLHAGIGQEDMDGEEKDCGYCRGDQ